MTRTPHGPTDLPSVHAITAAGEPDIIVVRVGVDSTDELGAAVLLFIEVKNGTGQAAAIPLAPWSARQLAGYLTIAADGAAALALGGGQ